MDTTALPALELSVRLALSASGLLLLVGLLTGVWKYAQIVRSASAQAHPYVDIAHRAALMYSFAALVMAALAFLSVWPEWVNVQAVIWPLLFFVLAIGSYVLHGLLADTDNQLQSPHRLGRGHAPGVMIHGFMVALIIAEIGGISVLLVGALCALW